MHIPDGYLSPATCAALYAASTPFWYTALGRLKRSLNARLIPLISVFSAFCFVIMMFNLPLPGGTTGHAVGVGIAAIVLGPWSGMLAISVALLIQAVLFGDGGLTTLGANCFNIAIVGSLVAYGCYRLVSGSAAPGSKRRVVAAGAAGYLAVNVSALLAAIEFGIQPMFFRDASGAPLYAPYPLSVAVPAMMAGHLTVAGMAEAFISAGLVAWLQRGHASLLESAPKTAGWGPARALLALLAVLMLLTPLGILAVGTAWGEWSPADFSDPSARLEIAAASRQQPLPAAVPSGLARLSGVWTSPFPGYAPPFLRGAAMGYALSALFGGGAILVAALVAERFYRARQRVR